MTTLNELRAAEPLQYDQIELVVATAVCGDFGDLRLTMVVNGQMKTFRISRSVAASAIGRIADELAKAP